MKPSPQPDRRTNLWGEDSSRSGTRGDAADTSSVHPQMSDPEAERCLLYLFGELDAVQSQRFEQTLQRDAALRQRFADRAAMVARLGESFAPSAPRAELPSEPAVTAAALPCAEQTNLSATTAPAPCPAAPVASECRSSRTPLWALVAASLLILAAGWWATHLRDQHDADSPEALATPQLAGAWLDTRDLVRHERDAVRHEDPAEQDDPLHADVAVDWPSPAEPPQWMLAAVAGMKREAETAGPAIEANGGGQADG